MPNKPPRACPRCGDPIWGKRCESCYPAWSNTTERSESSKVTGTRRWVRLRNQVRKEEPICRICVKRMTEEVDHIKPVSQGGAPYDRANLQGLCKPCHATKSQLERIKALRNRA